MVLNSASKRRRRALYSARSTTGSSRRTAALARAVSSVKRTRSGDSGSSGRRTTTSRSCSARAWSEPGSTACSCSRTKSLLGSKTTMGSRVVTRMRSRSTPRAYVLPEPLWPHQKVCRLSRLGTRATPTESWPASWPRCSSGSLPDRRRWTASGRVRRPRLRTGSGADLHQRAGRREAEAVGVARDVLDEGEHTVLAVQLEVVARQGTLARRAPSHERPPVRGLQVGGDGRWFDRDVRSHEPMMLTPGPRGHPLAPKASRRARRSPLRGERNDSARDHARSRSGCDVRSARDRSSAGRAHGAV